MMRIFTLVLVGGCAGAQVGKIGVPTDSTADTAAKADTGWPTTSGEDFAYFNPSKSEISVHYNDEQDIQIAEGASWVLAEVGATPLMCDYDGDGLSDIWLLTETDNKLFTVNIYLNQGGLWSSAPDASSTSDRALDELTAFCGDFDGDGRDDLYLFKTKNGGILGIPNKAGLDWAKLERSTTHFGADAKFLPADYNADGVDELGVWEGVSLSVYSMTNYTYTATSADWSVATSGASTVLALDYNDDGRADLGMWNGTSLVIYRGTGATIDTSDKVVFAIGGTGTPFGGRFR